MTRLTPDDGLRAAHEVVSSRHELVLEPRDIALLLILHAELESSTVQGFVSGVEDLRAIAAKVDVFLGLDPAAAEKRLTESVNRLLRAECLVRADLSRIKQAEHAQYQLTNLGQAVAEWHVQQARFDGEPLAAILAAFNVQLTSIYDQVQRCADEGQWQSNVASPLRYVAGELLSAVGRHQRALDRAHDEFRQFVPSLLKESTEEAIDRCSVMLDTVMATIRDLLSVTIDVSNAAFGLLDRIEDAAEALGLAGAAVHCEESRRRLDAIVEWTRQRHHDWSSHYDTVHSHLRFVATVDRSRKVTDALKRSIADVPDWTLQVAHAPKMLVLGERPAPAPKSVIRRPRQDQSHEAEEVGLDQLPKRLEQIADELLLSGQARWSSVVSQALAEEPLVRVITRLPDVMQYLLHRGRVWEGNRDTVPVGHGLTLEELEVRVK